MLGEILQGLTDANAAEAVLADVGGQEIRQRIELAPAQTTCLLASWSRTRSATCWTTAAKTSGWTCSARCPARHIRALSLLIESSHARSLVRQAVTTRADRCPDCLRPRRR